MPWHVARDTQAELVQLYGLFGGTAAKVAREIANLARPEIGEVSESHSLHRGSSSTMPQKRNPIGSETVVGLGNLATVMAAGAGRMIQPEHERAAGEWQLEWEVVPLAINAGNGALRQLAEVLGGLEIHRERMLENLSREGAVMSEAVMMQLAHVIGRQASYEVVYEVAQSAVDSQLEFQDALLADERLQGLVSRASLRSALDPATYTGEATELTRRGVDRWQLARADDDPLEPAEEIASAEVAS